jgi:putative chitinase
MADPIRITSGSLIAAGLIHPRVMVIAPTICDQLTAAFSKHYINSILRIASFFGQACQETDRFRVTTEETGYTAKRIREIWPRRFTEEDAVRIASMGDGAVLNYIYAGRIGNGPPESGDGHRFRGRGYLQITGKDTYTEFSKAMGFAELVNPDDVATIYAAESAAWFWESHGLNPLADRETGDLLAVTRRVNGGTLGIDNRKRYYAAALKMLGG